MEAVDVFFNMKAWATTQTSIDLIKETWHPYLVKMKDVFQKDRMLHSSFFCHKLLLSPFQSFCHGFSVASLMLHSASLFGYPPNLAGFADRFVLVLERMCLKKASDILQ